MEADENREGNHLMVMRAKRGRNEEKRRERKQPILIARYN